MSDSKMTMTRRGLLTTAAGAALSTPMINRAWAADPVEINMLAWYGHGEPDMVEEFEAMHNVKFKPKYYAGGDNMLALIAQSPPGTYDIILSDGEFVQQLNAAGYIEPMDADDYNFDDFFPEFQKFPGHWKGEELYSVMVRYGLLGVSFNTDVISHKEAMSYGVFWDDKLKGKVGHFDWHLPSLGEISLYNGNADPSPFDIDEGKWDKLQETMMSLRPQVGGFFDYGGTFSNLKNGEMHAMCGIGDWITGVLIPEEGGIQWTESYSIGKGTDKAEIVRDFIQYMLSPKGQVRSIQMAAYPGLSPTKSGWIAIQQENHAEAVRSGLIGGVDNSPIKMIREGRIHFRDIPQQQDLEDWNDFWSEYKNA